MTKAKQIKIQEAKRSLKTGCRLSDCYQLFLKFHFVTLTQLYLIGLSWWCCWFTSSCSW